ncbi:hypothetical protein [Parachlamydia sp. AcF125]|uniref:LIC_10091 family protein n=1 Tax=Parachlamydia sp. AcF125 TaxID=2795736 RepID=UPI001BCA54BD|nr:hypothetical protein [Parachlamydia sp. AcF125]MBS4167892.1 hypothetical protein [Parachlamydia sp. AcF125]
MSPLYGNKDTKHSLADFFPFQAARLTLLEQSERIPGLNFSIKAILLLGKVNKKIRANHPSHVNVIVEKITLLNNFNLKGRIGGVYISTNESNTKKSSEFLSTYPSTLTRCHVGFSGWHNLDIIAIRRSDMGVICDFNPQNKIFLEQTLECLLRSESREEFVKSMRKYVKESAITFSPNVSDEFREYKKGYSPGEEIRRELAREGSWLSSDAQFQYVKNLADEGKIALITEDIRNTKTFKKIANLVAKGDFKIDTLYLSNICHYMQDETDQEKFISTVKALANEETIIINCPKLQGKRHTQAPNQEILLAKDLKGNHSKLLETAC